MMGSLDGDTIEVQAQYNWVAKANCTEFLHLLQRGDYCNYYQYLGVISSIFSDIPNLLDIPDILGILWVIYCLNPGIIGF